MGNLNFLNDITGGPVPLSLFIERSPLCTCIHVQLQMSANINNKSPVVERTPARALVLYNGVL